MPNYLMEIPLHYLLTDDNFKLFNKIVDQINEENLGDFLNPVNNYLTKIREMLYFILENVCSYEIVTIEKSYFSLDYDGVDEDLDGTTKGNMGKVRNILNQMKKTILESFDNQELLNKKK